MHTSFTVRYFRSLVRPRLGATLFCTRGINLSKWPRESSRAAWSWYGLFSSDTKATRVLEKSALLSVRELRVVGRKFLHGMDGPRKYWDKQPTNLQGIVHPQWARYCFRTSSSEFIGLPIDLQEFITSACQNAFPAMN